MDASFDRAGDRYRLELRRRLAHPPEKVWRALTQRELLKQWFPCDVEGTWEVGGELRFHFLRGEGEGLSEEELRGKVLTVDPPRLLEFTWGKHVMRCELIAEKDGCTLVFSETLDDPSWGARNAAGWELCLDSLSAIVKGVTVAKFAWDVWQAKFAHYKKKYEPEHGPQQGPPDNHPVSEES